MPRPKKPRFVSQYPFLNLFGPLQSDPTGEVQLSLEEMEAIRLSDFENLDQETAAGLMQVSRQTYGRILSQARRTVAEALVTGKLISIGGGTYQFRGPGSGRRRRRRGLG